MIFEGVLAADLTRHFTKLELLAREARQIAEKFRPGGDAKNTATTVQQRLADFHTNHSEAQRLLRVFGELDAGHEIMQTMEKIYDLREIAMQYCEQAAATLTNDPVANFAKTAATARSLQWAVKRLAEKMRADYDLLD